MTDKQKKLYTVHAPIMGGVLRTTNEIALGPFIIRNNISTINNAGEALNAAVQFDALMNILLASVTKDTEYSILFKVEASTKEEAIELTCPYFDLFELVARFLLRDFERAQLGILHFTNYRLQSLSVTGDEDEDFSMSIVPQNVTLPTQFEQLLVSDEAHYIWNLVEKKVAGKCTNIEDRILNAISWIGRAEQEYQLPNKYVEYVFAIETLLSFDPKGTIITPSIAYQLSEFATFIISDTIIKCESLKNERIQLMKLFKKIYQNRSKVVHGNTQKIEEAEVVVVKDAVIRLVCAFIKNEKLSKMSTIEEVANWVNDIKFAGAGGNADSTRGL